MKTRRRQSGHSDRQTKRSYSTCENFEHSWDNTSKDNTKLESKNGSCNCANKGFPIFFMPEIAKSAKFVWFGHLVWIYTLRSGRIWQSCRNCRLATNLPSKASLYVLFMHRSSQIRQICRTWSSGFNFNAPKRPNPINLSALVVWCWCYIICCSPETLNPKP